MQLGGSRACGGSLREPVKSAGFDSVALITAQHSASLTSSQVRPELLAMDHTWKSEDLTDCSNSRNSLPERAHLSSSICLSILWSAMRIIPHAFLIQKSPPVAQYSTQTQLINSTANVKKCILRRASLFRGSKGSCHLKLLSHIFSNLPIPLLFPKLLHVCVSSLRKLLSENTFLGFCSHTPPSKEGCLNPFLITATSCFHTRLLLSPPQRVVDALTGF